ncbi:MAG: C40 family peptidase [Ferruginibacter sp.]|nr:C40 family peptidase [Ferruginibacter sp.]
MKNLLIVAVATGIISGTPISIKAQKAVNSLQQEATSASKKAKFITDIEIVRDFKPVETVEEISTPTINTTTKPVAKKADTKSAIEACTSVQFKYAQLMNVEVESLTNTKLLNFMEEWWATRYRYGGTTKKGIDCSSLTGTLLKDVYGVTVPRTAREQYRISNKLTRDELREGDFVFFNTRGGVSHVGIYLANGYFVHSSVSSGVTISSLNENYYSKKYISGGRPDLEKMQPQIEETE